MMKPNEFKLITLQNFKEFKRLYWLIVQNNFSYYMYRGQANENWELESSLFRFLKMLSKESNSSVPFNMIKYEENSLKLFMDGCRNFNHEFVLPESEDLISDWLMLLQQYGGKTRLLDFSRSFPNALYFMLDSTEYDANGSVWIINPVKINPKSKFYDNYKKFYEIERGFPSFKICPKGIGIISNIKSKRILFQQGALLFGEDFSTSFLNNLFPNKNIDEINEMFTEKSNLIEITKDVDEKDILSILNWTDLIKIQIPSDFKSKIGDLLQQNNINPFTIYPDFEGFVKNLFFIAQPSRRIYSLLNKLPDNFIRDEREEIKEIYRNHVISNLPTFIDFLNKIIKVKYDDCANWEEFETKHKLIVSKNSLGTYFANLRSPDDNVKYQMVKFLFELFVNEHFIP